MVAGAIRAGASRAGTSRADTSIAGANTNALGLAFKRKNEFKLENNLFPELGSGIASGIASSIASSIIKNSSSSSKKVINFAAATKNERIEIKEEIDEDDLLKPGWVYIHHNNKTGQIEYKFGKEVVTGDAEFYKYENHLDLCNLKSRINRLQWDCDRENHLGDLSPYHNKPTIKELLDNAYNTENYNISDRTDENNIMSSNDECEGIPDE